MAQPSMFGFSNAGKIEKTSITAIVKTTTGQNVWSGVCWKATNEGVSILPPKSGWNLRHGEAPGVELCVPSLADLRAVTARFDSPAALLSERIAERSKHRDAAVLELDLTVEADLTLGGGALGVLGAAKACRVEEVERRRDAGERLRELVRVEIRVGHRHLRARSSAR